ncbi:hypothetical protein N5B55_05025 [Ralstonia pickettii]|uniref:hypothetical protein n=1 Tax=Ralstonia pickettii TaxID=329 RepID=UPI002714D834|nr:hypothetical protein [Ralstonia pickettii]WKZ86317.1 hypothetical protein N5B55_05025 [Ralstonia pickettii]
MKVHVTPLKIKGVMKQKWMRAMGNARGIFSLTDKRDNINQRTTRVAELSQVEDAEGKQWVLFDAQLVWARDSMMLLSGYERRVEGIDTLADYAQTWVVRFPTPGEMGLPAPGHAEASPPTEEQIENALVEAGV